MASAWDDPRFRPGGGVITNGQGRGGWGGHTGSVWSGYSPHYAPGGVNNNANDIIGQFSGAGAFSPGGNPQLMQALSDYAASMGRSMRSQGANSAALAGFDPSQAAAFNMYQGAGINNSMANGLLGARSGFLQGQNQFGQNLFNQRFAAANNMNMMNAQNQGNAGAFGGDMMGAIIMGILSKAGI
jgi:hypothetical protein